METPRIYGDESRLRTAVTRAISSGDDLLAQVEGVRRLMECAERMDAYNIERAWEKDFRGWFNRTGRTIHKYLREQLIGVPRLMRMPAPAVDQPELMPVLGAELPPDTGKPRHVIHLDQGEEWLRHALDELRELRSVLTPATPTTGQRPPQSGAPPVPASWFRPSWWKLGTAASIASLVGVPLGVAAIILAVLWH